MLLLFMAAAAVLATVPAASASPPLPSSISAVGDSITRATDVCCWYGGHPRHSWSTGGAPLDGIRSHYERIRALKSSIHRRTYNHARTGAKMRDAPLQAQAAVTKGARYVTILMGANDVCTSSPATMTTVSDFRGRFQTTMDVLSSELPARSRVFVSSIPNVYRLWELFRGNAIARFVWSTARICQSMLSSTNTEQERQAVLAQVQAFNQVLSDVCGQYATCRFDDYAVFNYRFTARQVSKLDYFHPSLRGQAALASLTWQHSWWGSL